MGEEKSTYHPASQRTEAYFLGPSRWKQFKTSPICNSLNLPDDTDFPQRLFHSQTGTPQLGLLIRNSGRKGITRTNQVTINPQPLVLLVLLRHLLVHDERLDVSPQRKVVNT